MSRQKVLVLGTGGHAHSCVEAIESTGHFEIIGFVGEGSESQSQVLNYPIIGTDEDLSVLRNKCAYAVVGVGQINSPDIRVTLTEKLLEHGFQLPTIISSSAHVSKYASLGSGTVVMPDVLIMPGARVGEHCIINSKAILEHNVQIGNFTHVSTGSIANGSVKIGDKCFIGSGAIIREEIQVGNGCFLGMGANLKHNLLHNERFMGI